MIVWKLWEDYDVGYLGGRRETGGLDTYIFGKVASKVLVHCQPYSFVEVQPIGELGGKLTSSTFPDPKTNNADPARGSFLAVVESCAKE